MSFRSCAPTVLMCLSVLAAPGVASAAEPPTESLNVLLHPADAFWQEQAPARYRVRFTTGEGNAHLDRDFPMLTKLVRATIE